MKPLRISRRACLRGAGVALALPALEIMHTPTAHAQAAHPLRFLSVYSPNGFLMPKWTPTGTGGTSYTTPPLMAPLEALKADFNVLSGLGNYAASLGNVAGGSHTQATATSLTQIPISQPGSGEGIRNGVSLDQIIATKIGAQTHFPSIVVGSQQSSAGNSCEEVFSCAYNNNISWSAPTTPVLKQVNPRDIFDRFFKDVNTTTPMPDKPDNTALYQKSILDVVIGRADALRSKLGKTDRAKLDEYLTAVREVEMRIARLVDGGSTMRDCTVPTAPKDATQEQIPFQEHLDLLSDLIVLAFQCDVTRVGTYMFEHSFTDQRSFNFLPGVTARHHEITHGNQADQEEKINLFYVQRFAYLLNKMKAATEGDSNVLKNSIVYFTSEFGNAHAHDHRELPMIVAGNAAGKYKTGQHIVFPKGAGEGQGVDGKGNRDDIQLAHLHLTTLQQFDPTVTTFGADLEGVPLANKNLPQLMV